MKTVVFFLEEPSAREFLKGVLPKILSAEFEPQFVVFEGKQDLEKQLVRRLQGWQRPNSVFVVMRDQDAGDCHVIKQSLRRKCEEAGRPEATVRICCRELESWYLADLAAVERALNIKGIEHFGRQAAFREPDAVVNPAAELTRITKGVYQKVSGSRLIGRELDPNSSRSKSFEVFMRHIRSLK